MNFYCVVSVDTIRSLIKIQLTENENIGMNSNSRIGRGALVNDAFLSTLRELHGVLTFFVHIHFHLYYTQIKASKFCD